MQSVNAMKSMGEPSKPQPTRPGSRLRALVCAGLQATLAACSDAAPSAPAPTPLPLAAASPAASPTALDAPWLANVPSAPPATRPMPCPARVPEALNPPADATLELAWPASGVQIYVCAQAKPGDAPSW